MFWLACWGVWVYHLNKLLSAPVLSTQEWECKVCVFFWHRNNICPMVPSVTAMTINPFNSIRVWRFSPSLQQRNTVQTRLLYLLQVLFICHSPISSPILCNLHPFLNEIGNLFKWDMLPFQGRSTPSETPQKLIATDLDKYSDLKHKTYIYVIYSISTVTLTILGNDLNSKFAVLDYPAYLYHFNHELAQARHVD